MDMAPPAGSARRDKEGAKGSGFTGATFREARTHGTHLSQELCCAQGPRGSAWQLLAPAQYLYG